MPGRRDLLRCRDGAAEALAAAVREAGRLVLLGDVVELRHGPQAAAMHAALPVLTRLAAAMRRGGEVILVPGNHDHELLRGWRERRAAGYPPPPLALETVVDVQPAEALAELAAALAPAAVHVRYPGVWLREDVYATHGHYADRHTTVPMLERLAAGGMARIVGEPDRGPTRIEDYEAVLAPVYAWIHEVAQVGGPRLGASSHGASAGAWRVLAPDAPEASRTDGRRRLRRRALVAGFPALIAALNRAGLGPLRAELSGPELRRAALRAMGEVVERLEVRARHVIFGHSHRAGPLGRDGLSEWLAPRGQSLVNCGSWVHEPAFLAARPRESPYRGGFGVWLDDDGPPELVNLLDG